MAKRVKGQRTKSGRLSRSKNALQERNPPADYILDRRELFAWHRPTKGPDGRVGEIDQDVCDGIGQLHALGLLDGYGLDPQDMRDAGRFFGEHYWSRYRETGPRTGKYEMNCHPRDGGRFAPTPGPETAADRRFDRMDMAVTGYERSILMDLVVDRCWGDEITPWAAKIIAEALRRKGKVISGFPTADDWARLQACVRALLAIVDGGMEMRRAA